MAVGSPGVIGAHAVRHVEKELEPAPETAQDQRHIVAEHIVKEVQPHLKLVTKHVVQVSFILHLIYLYIVFILLICLLLLDSCFCRRLCVFKYFLNVELVVAESIDKCLI